MSPSSTQTPDGCHAEMKEGLLTLGNRHFSESWEVTPDGFLKPVQLRREGGSEWIDSTDCRDVSRWESKLQTRQEIVRPCAMSALSACLVLQNPDSPGHQRRYRFELYPDLPGTIVQVGLVSPSSSSIETEGSLAKPEEGGIEIHPNGRLSIDLPAESEPPLQLADRHLTLRAMDYVDQTDYHADFVHTREWMTHPSESCLPLKANQVSLEARDPARLGEGIVWVILAPTHHVRKGWSPPFDFLLSYENRTFSFRSLNTRYPVARLCYQGGEAGAALALQKLQRTQHRWDESRDGKVLSNTWGDRAGASHLSESFILKEIEAAVRLGVEVVQIDDGWQKGETINTSSDRSKGIWNGFWASSPDFWDPHPVRFPNGIRPLARAASEKGVELGLWYAPDSSGDFENWEKDAAQLLGIWKNTGVRHFKLDAVKLHSRLAEVRFHTLCDRVLEQSQEAITFDFDATAERRPTFWGRLNGGPLFLQNRYTDSGSYYPHQTLRALWSLTRAGILPSRLRLEFLNTERNLDRYESDDPLQPDRWPADYQLATVLAASPLAWMEVSELDSKRLETMANLLQTWKPYRESFHRGDIFPIGQPPTGFSWTGLLSLDRIDPQPTLYAIIFRELTDSDEFTFPIPEAFAIHPGNLGEIAVLAGNRHIRVSCDNSIRVTLPLQRTFAIVRWSIVSCSG